MNITFKVVDMELLEDVGPTLKAKAGVRLMADGVAIADLYECLVFHDDELSGDFWATGPDNSEGDPVIIFIGELYNQFQAALIEFYKAWKEELPAEKKVYLYIKEN